MAPFNPNPQEVPVEDFKNFTHPISPVEGNKALGTALAGVGQMASHAGEMAKDVGKVQEFNTRQAIENSEGVANYQKALDSTNQAYQNYFDLTQDTQARADASNNDILPTDAKGTNPANNPPEELKAAVAKVNAINTARLDVSRNQVLLAGIKDAEAKRLRSQYPDHADYIDHVFNSGNRTANQRLEALQSYYVRSQQGQDDYNKKIIDKAIASPQIPGIAPFIVNAINKGGAHVTNLLNYMNKMEGHIQEMKVANEEIDLSDKLAEHDSRNAFTSFIDKTMATTTNGMYVASGFSNANDIIQKVKDIQAGKVVYSPDDIENLRNATHSIYQQISAAAQSALFAQDSKGQSVAQKLGKSGGALGKQLIEERLFPLQQVIEAIDNKDFGLATKVSRNMQGFVDARTNQLLAYPDMRQYIIDMKTSTAISPEWGAKFYESAQPSAYKSYQTFLDTHKIASVSPNNNGVKVADAMAAIQKFKDNPQLAKDIINGVYDIWDDSRGLRNDDQKREAAKYFFDEYNNGITNLFPEDRLEKIGGSIVKIPGKLSIFRSLTDPRGVDTMKRLGPETWDMYKNWVYKEHTGVVFRSQLRNLQALPEQFGPQLKFGWDDKSGHFVVRDVESSVPKVGELQHRAGGAIRIPLPVQKALKDVNDGLDSINAIAKKDGVSPSVYTLNALRNLNFQFDGFQGIPKELLNSIEHSTRFPVLKQSEIKPGETPQQAFERKQKEPEAK